MLTNMYTRVCIHSLSCASCFWSVLSRLGCLQGPILTWVSALHGSGQYWAEIFTLPGEQCLDYWLPMHEIFTLPWEHSCTALVANAWEFILLGKQSGYQYKILIPVRSTAASQELICSCCLASS